jgi:hypothetical protein
MPDEPRLLHSQRLVRTAFILLVYLMLIGFCLVMEPSTLDATLSPLEMDMVISNRSSTLSSLPLPRACYECTVVVELSVW